ncbi:Cullin-domain-containing protein [Tilletiaria anomala UBC 951]|uniref:Cullin-domain-containing protein n=1 Tax=Tilletiaria anomala (strain ATCC 24038 / CBS 436.72 / UBC 951) TaxID=1037660 RepID=A0A066WFP3_TILAU|nr:Cullin-domain-containing protein [Tilletiaria anomala UBC 951]KDN52792.1 Cullin-domain-containing protein [Tilletiaria anomala UBC 951]
MAFAQAARLGPLVEAFDALQDKRHPARCAESRQYGNGGFSSVVAKLAAAQTAQQTTRRSLAGAHLQGSRTTHQPLKLQFVAPPTDAGSGASSPPSSQQLVHGLRQLLDLGSSPRSLNIDYNALYRQCELVASYSLRTSDDEPLQSLYEAVKVEIEKSLTALTKQLRSDLPPPSSDVSATAVEQALQNEQAWLDTFAKSWTTWKERTHLVANILLPLDRAAFRHAARLPAKRSAFGADEDAAEGEDVQLRFQIKELAIDSFAYQVMRDPTLCAAILPFTTRAVDTFCRIPQVEAPALVSSSAGKQPLPPRSIEASAFQQLYAESILKLFCETQSYDALKNAVHAATEAYYARLAPLKLIASKSAGQDAYAALYAHWMASVVEHETVLSGWLYDNEIYAGKAMSIVYNRVANDHAEELSTGISSVFDAAGIATLSHLYSIFHVASSHHKAQASDSKDAAATPLARLRTAFGAYIRGKVEAVVNDKSKDDEMVDRLLALKRNLDAIVADAFHADNDFSASMRDAFAWGVNRRDNKPPELIAKHVDVLLRSGNKTMSDTELETALNKALVLFRFTKDKDMFEEFYTRHFAKRLLLNKSASSDAEMSMLLKLKEECGPDFTRKLETMLKDVALSDDIMKAWERFEAKARGSGELPYQFDMSVNVLTQAHWPTYPQHEIILPTDMAQATETFNVFYQGRNSGRKLQWQHSLGNNTIIAEFPKAGQKELLVSTYQAVILTLFNGIESGKQLPYKDIAAQTGLEAVELKRSLQSLACGPIPTRVLRKSPQGRDVNDGDTFSVNDKIKNDRLRIRINQVQMAQTQEEQKDTEQRVLIDRELVLQAAAVRVLKAKREIKHSDLMTEVVEQIKGRFGVEASELKKTFESLLEKDYMERVEGQRGVYRYVA